VAGGVALALLTCICIRFNLNLAATAFLDLILVRQISWSKGTARMGSANDGPGATFQFTLNAHQEAAA